MAITLFERWSPEYALNKAFDDMRVSGLDGLKKHLTANALKVVTGVESIAGRNPEKGEKTCPKTKAKGLSPPKLLLRSSRSPSFSPSRSTLPRSAFISG